MMIEPLGDGGMAHYAYNLVNALNEKDVEISLFTNRSYEFSSQAKSLVVYQRMFFLANVLIKKFPWLDIERGLASMMRRFIKLIEYPFNLLDALYLTLTNDIDIVHIQSVNMIEVLMVILFRLFRKKVIFTVHNIQPRHNTLKIYHKIIYFIMYLACHKIIIHSEKGRDELINLFNIDHNKTYVVPHGDYKFFVPENLMSIDEAKASIHIDPKTKTILFFGAIRSNKGLDIIIKAMPNIMKNIKDVKLLIVGEPWEDYGKYRKMIEDYNLSDNVWEKLGYIPNGEVSRYFFAADLVVLPYYEITGSGILQIAYAFAKPVIASDIDGFKETIEDGKNGYLVNLGDPDNMATKICEVLLNENLCDRMGLHSRFISDNKYSWQGIAERTKSIYSLALNNK